MLLASFIKKKDEISFMKSVMNSEQNTLIQDLDDGCLVGRSAAGAW